MNVKKFGLYALLILFGVGSGVGILEIGLRVFGYKGNAERNAFAYDTIFGDIPANSWGFKLGQTDSKVRPDTWEINGEKVPIKKGPAEIRVLFLGDSGTFGSRVGFTNSYPIQLRHLVEARFPGKDIRVVNAGVIGMNTVNELQLFETYLRRSVRKQVKERCGSLIKSQSHFFPFRSQRVQA